MVAVALMALASLRYRAPYISALCCLRIGSAVRACSRLRLQLSQKLLVDSRPQSRQGLLKRIDDAGELFSDGLPVILFGCFECSLVVCSPVCCDGSDECGCAGDVSDVCLLVPSRTNLGGDYWYAIGEAARNLEMRA